MYSSVNELFYADVVQKDPEVNFNQSGKEVRESPTIGSLRASQQQQETCKSFFAIRNCDLLREVASLSLDFWPQNLVKSPDKEYL